MNADGSLRVGAHREAQASRDAALRNGVLGRVERAGDATQGVGTRDGRSAPSAAHRRREMCIERKTSVADGGREGDERKSRRGTRGCDDEHRRSAPRRGTSESAQASGDGAPRDGAAGRVERARNATQEGGTVDGRNEPRAAQARRQTRIEREASIAYRGREGIDHKSPTAGAKESARCRGERREEQR